MMKIIVMNALKAYLKSIYNLLILLLQEYNLIFHQILVNVKNFVMTIILNLVVNKDLFVYNAMKHVNFV